MAQAQLTANMKSVVEASESNSSSSEGEVLSPYLVYQVERRFTDLAINNVLCKGKILDPRVHWVKLHQALGSITAGVCIQFPERTFFLTYDDLCELPEQHISPSSSLLGTLHKKTPFLVTEDDIGYVESVVAKESVDESEMMMMPMGPTRVAVSETETAKPKGPKKARSKRPPTSTNDDNKLTKPKRQRKKPTPATNPLPQNNSPPHCPPLCPSPVIPEPQADNTYKERIVPKPWGEKVMSLPGADHFPVIGSPPPSQTLSSDNPWTDEQSHDFVQNAMKQADLTFNMC